jgi:gliding motility-associated protein GldM
MSIPKEPRQLMINLMYLVLTAMLAINVSSEILNAFKIINKSINRSNDNIGAKNEGTITNFEDALKDPKVIADPKKKGRIEEALARANQVRTATDGIVNKIKGYSNEIVKQSGGYLPELSPLGDSVLKAESDLDAATIVMIERDKRGLSMINDLKTYKKSIVDLAVNPSDTTIVINTKQLDSLLPINFDYGTKNGEGTPEQWANYNFHMVPTIGAKTILDKYINDVRNSENIVLDQIWAEAFGEKVKPPKVPPVILITNQFLLMNSPENTYLLPGEKYKSKIVIGSYNTSNSQAVYIAVNGAPRSVVNGIADFETTADPTPGEHTINIQGTIYDPNKKVTVPVAPIQAKYFTATAAASISLDKMNVFYIGVDNPISVSASGILMKNLALSSTGNIQLNKVNDGQYTVRVTGPGGTKGTITLSGTKNDGTTQSFGTREYRIKTIPPPIVKYMGLAGGGKIGMNKAKIGLQLEAILENFDFECKFEVLEYSMAVITKDEEQAFNIKGPFISSNPAADKARKSLKNKSQLIFENIYVMGCDKIRRRMPDMTFSCTN